MEKNKKNFVCTIALFFVLISTPITKASPGLTIGVGTIGTISGLAGALVYWNKLKEIKRILSDKEAVTRFSYDSRAQLERQYAYLTSAMYAFMAIGMGSFALSCKGLYDYNKYVKMDHKNEKLEETKILKKSSSQEQELQDTTKNSNPNDYNSFHYNDRDWFFYKDGYVVFYEDGRGVRTCDKEFLDEFDVSLLEKKISIQDTLSNHKKIIYNNEQETEMLKLKVNLLEKLRKKEHLTDFEKRLAGAWYVCITELDK